MNWPLSLRLQVKQKNHKALRLWIPGFLLGPILLLVGALALPVLLLVDVIGLLFFKRFICTRLFFACLRLLAAAKGFELKVQSKNEDVLISIQ